MKIPDEICVLYQDPPRKRYRRIAAKTEQSASHLQFLVEIAEGEPFEVESSHVQTTMCATRSEALTLFQEERASSLRSGWREYPDEPRAHQ